MSSSEDGNQVYRPKDAIGDGLTTTMIVGGGGLALSAIQNTLARQNIGPWGLFTRTGGTVAIFAAVGGTFGFVESASANLREKNDSWNAALGGFMAGAVGGLRYRSFPAVIGFGAGLAVLEGIVDYTGGNLSGFFKDPKENEYERKEELRKDRRRPIQETFAEIGEGRGIYGPGYRERRAQRLKDLYGIEVPRG